MTPKSLRIIREEHASLSSMLQSLIMMVDRGPGDAPEKFFDVVRAMLFYIDEFPEKLHHPKETELLFPKVVRADPACADAIRRLDADHHRGESKVRELQHLLQAWEYLGDSRRDAFTASVKPYVHFYLSHMHAEEEIILPSAQKHLSAQDWQELDDAFAANKDPLSGHHGTDTAYDRLFTRIVMNAPSPIGVGS